MYAPDQLGAQSVMHRPVPGQSAHVFKDLGCNLDVEMALPAFLISRMAPVAFADVTDGQFTRMKRFIQGCANFFFYQQISAPGSSILARAR